MPSPIFDAGHALAAFAREIAVEAVRASGDVMDGAHAEALAAAWDEAMAALEHDADPTVALAHTLGWMRGAEHGQALRDELLHLARCLRSGFGAALCFESAPGPDCLLGKEEAQSVAVLHTHIAAANGAANRLAQLELETEGQGTLL